MKKPAIHYLSPKEVLMNSLWSSVYALAIALLVGCSTTSVDLRYSPSAAVRSLEGMQAIEVGTFVDQRGVPANWLGSVRGGFYQPIKNLETSAPVSKIVERAVSTALTARGYTQSSGSAAVVVAGVIKNLYCHQLMQREAGAEIEFQIIDRSSKRTLFSRTYSATNYEESALGGLLASIEDLRALTERTMQEAIDKALDDTSLQLALK